MIKTISAAFEVVTPMFLGGADQSSNGIRPSSVKGALRFWWRALAWSGVRAQCNDDHSALQALHREEARLFGLAAQENVGGQGAFMLHVRDNIGQAIEQPFDRGFDNGILYLLGQGLGKALAPSQGGNQCTRTAIRAGATFEIKLIFRPQATSEDQDSIVSALKLFGLLGALGSRARHGLGSVAIQHIKGDSVAAWKAPATVQGYEQELLLLLPESLPDAPPPLSALSKLTRIDLSLNGSNVAELLANVGREQQAYRSYGRNGQVNGHPSEFNFVGDHDLALHVSQGEQVNKTPTRIVFGLPQNYFFSSTQGKADVNYKPGDGEGRRASPLLFHVHKIGKTCVGMHVLLIAQFLPPSHLQPATIELKGNRKANLVPLSQSDVKWQILHTYLNRYTQRTTIYGQQ